MHNTDRQGNTIVSRITSVLGSLKTLSAYKASHVSVLPPENAEDDDGARNFNLFTHHQWAKEGKKPILTYDALKEGVLELYLSVKIRSDEEIDNYNEDVFKLEKKQMKNVDGYTLIDHIKSAIEVLMNMKAEE